MEENPLPASSHGGTDKNRPRTIVTTDPELDDLNSMLQLLLYSNEIDIRGLVYSSSQFHYAGNSAAGVEPYRWPAPEARLHIDQAVDAYAHCYSNLLVHDQRYPSPDYLRSITKIRNVENVGEMSAPTPGSELIYQEILSPSTRRLFLQAWGGTNTIARALKSVEEQFSDDQGWDELQEEISARLVITAFGQQDSTFRDYIRPSWPRIEFREVSTETWGYTARNVVPGKWRHYLDAAWITRNISSVGPIGATYRVWGDGKQMAAGFDLEDYFGIPNTTAEELEKQGFTVWGPVQEAGSWISEGDSSNFVLLIDNGLRSHVHPGFGGWGGRQEQDPDDPYYWANSLASDSMEEHGLRADLASSRWFEDFQRDFAGRLRWTVASEFSEANHAPTVSITPGLDLQAAAGTTVDLTIDVTDPDGDDWSATWFQYLEAGTCPYLVPLTVDGFGNAKIHIPREAQAGQTVHLICRVEDDGTPHLVSYQRVVLAVAEQM